MFNLNKVNYENYVLTLITYLLVVYLQTFELKLVLLQDWSSIHKVILKSALEKAKYVF